MPKRSITSSKLNPGDTDYREIFDKANDAIYIHEIATGKILDVNQKGLEIANCTKQELQQQSLPNFFSDSPQFNLKKAIDLMQRAASGTPQLFEWLVKKKDSTYTWFEVNLKTASMGGEKRILAFFREINDRKRNEQKISEHTIQLENIIQELKENEEKFQKAFQASAAGISITRISDATYLEVNNTFVQLTGFSKEELIGHSSVELGMVVNLKRREEVLQHVREHGWAKNFEITIRHKSGKIFEVLSSVETILLKQEKYAINIIYDITDRKKAEQQLEAVNKELESFSYSVSHDLRAPLRSIIGYSKALEEDYVEKLDDGGLTMLNKIHNNAVKMNGLIDSLLMFSMMGKKELQKSEIETEKLVQTALTEINSALQHKARVVMNPLFPMYADPALLTQVWTNLISNAVKYSIKSNEPVIEIGSIKEESETVYYIKDNGAGFDMKYADKLFGVFQRLHKSQEFEGSGIGLSTVKRIINKHGGRVWAEGKVNEGATFYFSLPI